VSDDRQRKRGQDPEVGFTFVQLLGGPPILFLTEVALD